MRKSSVMILPAAVGFRRSGQVFGCHPWIQSLHHPLMGCFVRAWLQLRSGLTSYLLSFMSWGQLWRSGAARCSASSYACSHCCWLLCTGRLLNRSTKGLPEMDISPVVVFSAGRLCLEMVARWDHGFRSSSASVWLLWAGFPVGRWRSLPPLFSTFTGWSSFYSQFTEQHKKTKISKNILKFVSSTGYIWVSLQMVGFTVRMLTCQMLKRSDFIYNKTQQHKEFDGSNTFS